MEQQDAVKVVLGWVSSSQKKVDAGKAEMQVQEAQLIQEANQERSFGGEQVQEQVGNAHTHPAIDLAVWSHWDLLLLTRAVRVLVCLCHIRNKSRSVRAHIQFSLVCCHCLLYSR